jgi:hypothetical protein
VFDEIPHSEKVLKRHQDRDDPCIMAWDHYIYHVDSQPIQPLVEKVIMLMQSSADPTPLLRGEVPLDHIFL